MFKKKLFWIVVVGLLVAAVIWGRGDQILPESNEQAVVSQGVDQVQIPEGTPAAVTQPLSPEKAKIVQTAADLVVQIADNAYNDEKTEAIVAAAAAVSLRVSTLKAQSAIQSEKAAQSLYQKALAEEKQKNVEKEATASLPKESAEPEQPYHVQPTYSMPYQRPSDVEQSAKSDGSPFDSVELNGIISTDELDVYKAVFLIENVERTVREGQGLPGGLKVVEVRRNKVVISDGDDSRTLYVR